MFLVFKLIGRNLAEACFQVSFHLPVPINPVHGIFQVAQIVVRRVFRNPFKTLEVKQVMRAAISMLKNSAFCSQIR
jgi:hypothetical protein